MTDNTDGESGNHTTKEPEKEEDQNKTKDMPIRCSAWADSDGWTKLEVPPYLHETSPSAPNVWKKVVREGKGEVAGKGAILSIHAKGHYFEKDGSMVKKPFWNTREYHDKQPVLFYSFCGQASRGFEEGCVTMKEGEIAQFKISSDLGYGRYGHQIFGVPPNVDLIFEVELMDHHPD